MNFIKYILVLILKYFLDSLAFIGRIIKKFFYYLLFPFHWFLKRIIFYGLILSIYKIYLNFNNIYQKISKILGNWIFAPLTTRYTIHILIVVISFGVITSNIYAKELEAQITPVEGQNSILMALITPPENELIEESANYDTFAEIYDYPLSEQEYLASSDYIPTIEIAYLETVDYTTLAKPHILTTTTNLKLRNKTEDYIILGGDTLSGIADKFGLNITTVLQANNLSLRSRIKPGQALTILPVDGLLYTVKSGDTISKLASTYQAQTNQIREFNQLSDSSLPIGEDILIPYGVKPKPVYVAPTVAYRPSYSSTPQAATNTGDNSGVNNKVAYGNAAPATSAVYAPEFAPASAAVSGTALQWPTSDYVITQYYHYGHTGLDIAGASRYNAPLYAAESGTVIKAQGGWNGGYGVYVILDHGNGLQTLYAHASQLFVQPGEYVERGQPVAMMGTTGRSTGPHIHFEVRKNGGKVNPLNYIR